MKRSERITLYVVCILFLLALVVTIFARAEDAKAPSLTDAQKLSIRSAQVEYLSAQQAAQSTPQYQAMVAAQAKLNDAVHKALKDAGIDQSKFQLQSDLTLVEFHPSPPPPKPTEKK